MLSAEASVFIVAIDFTVRVLLFVCAAFVLA